MPTAIEQTLQVLQIIVQSVPAEGVTNYLKVLIGIDFAPQVDY